MKRVIKLKDKKHELISPSPYGAELMRTWGDDPVGPVAVSLAAVMTDSEPKDAQYRPRKVWYPGEVAMLLPPTFAEREVIATAVYELLEDAGIIGGEKKETNDEVDPPIPGAATQSRPRATSKTSASPSTTATTA
jgi:hypothetical protein